MAFIQDLSRQFGGFVGAQPMARKLTLLAIIVGSIGAMAFLVIHAQTGSYTVLYQGLEPSDAGEIVRVLGQKGIRFRTENSNSIIKVQASRIDEAFMLVSMEGLPNSGTVGYEGLDKSTIGQSNFAQQKNYKRMQEGELARTMVKFEGVEQARVLIAVPDETPFLAEQQKATASVQLKLRTGYQLSERQISGISHLVSHAIKGLDDKNVVIVDQKGNLLNQSRGEESQNSVAQQQFKLGYEDRLKHEVESLIENTIGRGRVAARVQAEFDYASQKEERQVFNPDAQDPIPTKEQTETEPAPKTALAATTGTAAVAPAGPTRTMREYAVSQQRTETQNNVPQLKRVTVAVLADGKHAEKDGKDEYTPLTDAEIANIENLVKATIGFSEERGDVVTVQCSPFTNNELTPMDDVGWLTPDVRRIIELSLHWGIIGLIALMLIMMVLRPAVKQITVASGPMAALPAGAGGHQWIEAGGAGAAANGATPIEAGSMASKLLGNTDQARMFQAQQAAENARVSQAQAQQIQREVIETTKNQPQKTVSLLRQWMDEA
ncbi:MAG: flagellar basal-body MS-ring/collar protein FliF [Candidatus Sumerlaeia bacterium]